jgi:hypothetical protein
MFGNLPWTEYVHARAFLTQQEVNVLQRTEEASLDFAIEDSVSLSLSQLQPLSSIEMKRERKSW